MVVNVDHLCPGCSGIGPCELCNSSGCVRAPADWVGTRSGRMSGAQKTLHGEDFVGDEPRDDISCMQDAFLRWRESPVGQGLLPNFVDKEDAMKYAFEAGHKDGYWAAKGWVEPNDFGGAK